MNEGRISKKLNRTILLVLASVGLANIGEWIYFIALNLIVLNRGGTAFSVGVLYIMRPVATIFVNALCHTLVDKLSKRRWLIYLDILRSSLIALLLVNESLIWVYSLVFLIQSASSLYEPLAVSYITLVIPTAKRKKFNAWNSLVSSGGFLVGPAIAGLLLTLGTPNLAILINALALFSSALLTAFLPDFKLTNATKSKAESLWLAYKNGFREILAFVKQDYLVVLLYGLISLLFIFAAGLDSVEAAFAKEVLGLSDGKYGLMISAAGAGFVVGSMINSLIVERLSVKQLIVFGAGLYTMGYLIFSTAITFLIASLGCFLLSFALAFVNTGFKTFIQIKLPIEKLGQITTSFGIFESILEVLLVAFVSGAASIFPLRWVVICVELVMILAVLYLIKVIKKVAIVE